MSTKCFKRNHFLAQLTFRTQNLHFFIGATCQRPKCFPMSKSPSPGPIGRFLVARTHTYTLQRVKHQINVFFFIYFIIVIIIIIGVFVLALFAFGCFFGFFGSFLLLLFFDVIYFTCLLPFLMFLFLLFVLQPLVIGKKIHKCLICF